MHRLTSSCLPLLFGLLAPASVAAGTVDDPLLVVVEGQPGSGLDAREVRRAVERELAQRVVAPNDAGAAKASRVLLVAIDGRRIAVSLRTVDGAPPPRTIEAPRDPAAEVRAVAWLAGNLARDQVSPLIAAAVPASLVDAAAPSPAPPSSPPPIAVEPPPAPTPVESVRVAGAATVSQGPQWTITGSGGPTVVVVGLRANDGVPGPTALYGVTYHIEVQRQSAPGALIVGAALDAGPDGESSGLPHALGLAALVGSRWVHPRWYWEATAGLGVEQMLLTTTTETLSNSSATGAVSTSVVSGQARLVLYMRGEATFGLPLGRPFDLVASLGLHLTTQGLDTSFANATVGLRVRIP